MSETAPETGTEGMTHETTNRQYKDKKQMETQNACPDFLHRHCGRDSHSGGCESGLSAPKGESV